MSDPTETIVRLAVARVLQREARTESAPGRAASSQTQPDEAEPAGVRGFRGDVALASDHGGFALKEALRDHLRYRGYRVRDLGPATAESCDYPDLALRVAKAVASGKAWRGVMVDGVGIGSAMAAGKVPGIRAATCFDEFSTKNSRAHNDANMLCIGGRVLDTKEACALTELFLETAFEGGRHARRVDKIMSIEQAFTGPVLAALERGGRPG